MSIKADSILCVEDHPVFRDGLGAISGWQANMLLVQYAGNAVRASAEFHRHQPDITLMDQHLPGSNGTDALIAVRGARVITSAADGEIQRAMRGVRPLAISAACQKTTCSKSSVRSMAADSTCCRKWLHGSPSIWAIRILRHAKWKFSDSFEMGTATDRSPINWSLPRPP